MDNEVIQNLETIEKLCEKITKGKTDEIAQDWFCNLKNNIKKVVVETIKYKRKITTVTILVEGLPFEGKGVSRKESQAEKIAVTTLYEKNVLGHFHGNSSYATSN